MTDITRRKFVKTVAATGAAFTILPRHVLGRGMQAPSDTVNVAAVGIGGRGGSDLAAVLSQNIVAICDVDETYLEKRFTSYKRQVSEPPSEGGGRGNRPPRPLSPAQIAANQRRPATDEMADLRKFVDGPMTKVPRYKDYREMLEKQKDIDAIIIATPDHMHAAIASAAMDLGKHVYCEKPLCWSVKEARHLAAKAKSNPKIVTQMGNQGHSRDEARTGYEYITSGAIGDVREVHVWTNRPLGFWPQGIPRPAPLPAEASDRPLQWNNRDIDLRLAAAMAGNYPVPPGLSWDLFLGAGPVVDYHPVYHPFNWRGWVDWGQGATRRHGRAPHRSSVLVAEARHALVDRNRLDAVQRRLLSARHDDALSVPGARQHAGGEADVVRRRLCAAEAGRDRRRKAERRRRRALHRIQGQVDAGDLRSEPAPAAAVAPGVDERAQAEAPADRARRASDELDRGDQGEGRGVHAV